ncbi:MAG TPA: type VI secretion system tube protein Hcp, partial [Candidatus Binatia bacterium]|nr:type VI secretion system tube protein Hcp [Candidatus Binatia bacterium]
MAVDMFMTVDGIEGESKDGSHKNEIDVLSWSWGLSQSGTGHVGGGSGSGKVSVH